MLIRLHCNSFSLSTPSWRPNCLTFGTESCWMRRVVVELFCRPGVWTLHLPDTCVPQLWRDLILRPTLFSQLRWSDRCSADAATSATWRGRQHGRLSPTRGKGQRICGTPRASDELKFSSRTFIDSVFHLTSVPAVGRVTELRTRPWRVLGLWHLGQRSTSNWILTSPLCPAEKQNECQKFLSW